jgi:hypothetical protein
VRLFSPAAAAAAAAAAEYPCYKRWIRNRMLLQVRLVENQDLLSKHTRRASNNGHYRNHHNGENVVHPALLPQLQVAIVVQRRNDQ